MPVPFYVLVITGSLLVWQFLEDKICILAPHSEARFIHKKIHPLTVAWYILTNGPVSVAITIIDIENSSLKSSKLLVPPILKLLYFWKSIEWLWTACNLLVWLLSPNCINEWFRSRPISPQISEVDLFLLCECPLCGHTHQLIIVLIFHLTIFEWRLYDHLYCLCVAYVWISQEEIRGLKQTHSQLNCITLCNFTSLVAMMRIPSSNRMWCYLIHCGHLSSSVVRACCPFNVVISGVRQGWVPLHVHSFSLYNHLMTALLSCWSFFIRLFIFLENSENYFCILVTSLLCHMFSK